MTNCWEVDPNDRRSFTEICLRLMEILEGTNACYNYVDASNVEVVEVENVDEVQVEICELENVDKVHEVPVEIHEVQVEL